MFEFVFEFVLECVLDTPILRREKTCESAAGPNTTQQCLRAGLIDELHIAIAPVLLGSGERPLEGVDLQTLGIRTR